MNANELADELEHTMRHRTDTVFTKSANMLRQQQAEIEMLKKLLDDFGITVNRKAQEK
jgi:hypothetical protein